MINKSASFATDFLMWSAEVKNWNMKMQTLIPIYVLEVMS